MPLSYVTFSPKLFVSRRTYDKILTHTIKNGIIGRNIRNTCRSPMAESVMRDLVRKNRLDWEIDSAGLMSWNVGKTPQERCIKVLAEHNLKTSHLGREVKESDYHTFDYIFGMDEVNIEDLINRSPQQYKAKIELLGSYIGRKEDEIIVDPYFEHGIAGFRRCYEQIYTSCKNFLATQVQKE